LPTLCARWATLGAALIAEIVLLSMRFDTGSLNDVSSEWALAVAITPRLIRLGLLTVVVASALSWSKTVHELNRSANDPSSRRAAYGWIALHAGCLAAFVWLTAQILEQGRAASDFAGIWTIAWAASGALAAGSWALAAMPWRKWRRLAARMRTGLAVGACVALSVWISESFGEGIWQPLARSTIRTVHAALQLVYPEVICQVSNLTIGTPSFAVRIDPDCSGYEGMALVLAFLAGYLWFDRESLRFPQALILLPVGVVASWIANVLRTSLLVMIGSSWSEAIAMGGFHSQAGALAVSCIALGLVIVARRSSWFATTPSQQTEWTNPTATYLAPLLALLATMMVTGAFTSDFDYLYPLRVAAVAAVLWHFRRDYRKLLGQTEWLAKPLSELRALGPSLAIGAGVFLLWMALEPLAAGRTGPDDFSMRLNEMPTTWAALWLTLRVIGSVATVSIAEELAFRGYLLRRLISADFEAVSPKCFTWLSFIASSLAFGALHGRVLAGSLAGALFALALYRRGRICDAIFAHAGANALIAARVLATGDWALWT
jgi:exosortase E/protease (VPEID-CTERM system)